MEARVLVESNWRPKESRGGPRACASIPCFSSTTIALFLFSLTSRGWRPKRKSSRNICCPPDFVADFPFCQMAMTLAGLPNGKDEGYWQRELNTRGVAGPKVWLHFSETCLVLFVFQLEPSSNRLRSFPICCRTDSLMPLFGGVRRRSGSPALGPLLACVFIDFSQSRSLH